MSRSHGSEGSSDSLLDRSIDSEEGLDDRPSSPADTGKLKRKKGGSKKGKLHTEKNKFCTRSGFAQNFINIDKFESMIFHFNHSMITCL